MYSKRRINILWMILLALGLALAPACSDDGTSGTEDQELSDAGDDSSSEQDAPSDAGSDSDEHVADSGEDVSDSGPATDADAASDDTGEQQDATDGGNADAADVEEVDAPHTGCAYPPVDSTCPDGPHGPGSFMNEFVLKESGECCHDYSGNGSDDSALGDLAATLKPFLGDFNQVIAYQIQNGVLVYLFEYAYWSDETNDAELELDLFFGQDTDSDFGPNLAGNGDFYVEPDSLDNNGDPRSDFPSASVTNSRLSVSGGTAPLSLPVGADLIEVEVTDIIIDADVVSGADFEAGGRIALTNGELAGLVTLDDLFSALNDVARNCSCISTDPVFTEEETDRWACNSTQSDADACDADPNATQLCKTLASREFDGCPTVASMLSNAPDLDRDNNGSKETISLGATFEAVGAKIVGVAP